MKEKIVTRILFFSIGCILGIVITEARHNSILAKNGSREEALIEYEDILPVEKFQVLKGKKQTKETLDESYKIFLYIDPYCDSCIEKFSVIERMYKILQKEKIGMKIIWKQKPQDSFSKAVNIPKENQYVTDKTSLLNEYPLYLITDKNNKIIMITDEENKVMQKIFSFSGIEKKRIIQASNSYLKSLIDDPNNEKQSLIYFAMEGCPDCENAMEMLHDSSILNDYNAVTVYTKDSYGEKELVDSGNLFMSIYGIEWYPSFLILNGDDEYQFIGQKPEQELLDSLKDGL